MLNCWCITWPVVFKRLNLSSAERGVSMCCTWMSVNPVRGKSQLRATKGDRKREASISNCKLIWRVIYTGNSSYKFFLNFACLESRMTYSVATSVAWTIEGVIFRFPAEIYFFSKASRPALMSDQLPFQWTCTSWCPAYSIPTAVRSKDFGPWPLECWNRGYESRCWHGHSSLVGGVTSWSLVRRSHTGCVWCRNVSSEAA